MDGMLCVCLYKLKAYFGGGGVSSKVGSVVVFIAYERISHLSNISFEIVCNLEFSFL